MGCCDSINSESEELLCYCFNISKKSYVESLKNNEHKTLKDFVIWQTKHNYCNCTKLNPSEKCCLKDFKSLDKDFLENT